MADTVSYDPALKTVYRSAARRGRKRKRLEKQAAYGIKRPRRPLRPR